MSDIRAPFRLVIPHVAALMPSTEGLPHALRRQIDDQLDLRYLLDR